MKNFILSLSLCALLCTPACARHITPSSNTASRTENIGSFSSIEASRVKVIYTVGEATGRAEISAPENLMQYVIVRVNDGKLKVKLDNDVELRNFNSDRITITVSGPAVEEIDAKLSATVEVNGKLDVREFSAETSTSGSIVLGDVKTRRDCTFESSTSGSVSARNVQCGDKAEFDASTSGTVSVTNLTAQTIEAEASTSGTVSINGGSANSADYEAQTSGTISAAALTAARGKASASTSGTVDCRITNATIHNSTGGQVTNR